MIRSSSIIGILVWLTIARLGFATRFESRTTTEPRYQHLPPLREQAKIYDEWRKERLSKVPRILQKYGVDAWIVSGALRRVKCQVFIPS